MLRENVKANEVGKVIENERLLYPPEDFGSRREYHAFTRGFILNEVFRRVSPGGVTIGEYLDAMRSDLDADVFIGTPLKEQERMASVTFWSRSRSLYLSLLPDFLDRRMRLTPAQVFSLNRAVRSTGAPAGRANPVPWFEPRRVMRLADSVELTKHPAYLSGEVPSSSGVCSARGMAKLARQMVAVAQTSPTVMSWETRRLMHSAEKSAPDFCLHNISEGISPTAVTQGGVNHFLGGQLGAEDIPVVRNLREGFYGWHGYGGSVLQWLPPTGLYSSSDSYAISDEGVAFAYVPTLWAWYDSANIQGAELQSEVVKCIKKRKKSAQQN